MVSELPSISNGPIKTHGPGTLRFHLSVTKPKPSQLLTNWATKPISNRSKTNLTTTKVIA